MCLNPRHIDSIVVFGLLFLLIHLFFGFFLFLFLDLFLLRFHLRHDVVCLRGIFALQPDLLTNSVEDEQEWHACQG